MLLTELGTIWRVLEIWCREHFGGFQEDMIILINTYLRRDLQALSGLWPNLKEPFDGDRASLVWIFILEYPSGIAGSGNPWIYDKILFHIHVQIQS